MEQPSQKSAQPISIFFDQVNEVMKNSPLLKRWSNFACKLGICRGRRSQSRQMWRPRLDCLDFGRVGGVDGARTRRRLVKRHLDGCAVRV